MTPPMEYTVSPDFAGHPVHLTPGAGREITIADNRWDLTTSEMIGIVLVPALAVLLAFATAVIAFGL
jgi:hypothetical protein